jgi:hypothetical protein
MGSGVGNTAGIYRVVIPRRQPVDLHRAISVLLARRGFNDALNDNGPAITRRPVVALPASRFPLPAYSRSP